MFTGIIQTIGTVYRRENGRLVVTPDEPLRRVRIGESIAVDGVCLTLEQVPAGRLQFRLLPETARVSTLGALRTGRRVNLERALRASDRLGGHLLLGHIDGRGRILRRVEKSGAVTLEIQVPPGLAAGLVPKGPIAVDGVSLTVNIPVPGTGMVPGTGCFSVHLVSHTLKRTTLGLKKRGDPVHLELDLVLKYLRGML